MTQVKIYTTSTCPYCDAAKHLLRQLSIPYEEENLDHNQELRIKLSQENNGWRTVPMIFIDNQFIGGFDDLNKLYKSGKLQKNT